MYAIAFDFDISKLQANYQAVTGSPSYNNGYAALRDELGQFGFTRQQGSLYYGGSDSSAIKCVLAIQAAAANLPWLKPSLSDVRMLRIEEDDDLMAVI